MCLNRKSLPALIEWRKGKSGYLFITEASINLSDGPGINGYDGPRWIYPGLCGELKPPMKAALLNAINHKTKTETW